MSTALTTFVPQPHDPPVLQHVPAAIEQIANFLTPDETKLFVENLALYVRSKPELADCEPSTTLQAVLKSARLGLTLGTEADLVAYKMKAKDGRDAYVSATLIVGYKGIMAMAQRRHGIQIMADVIRHGDVYEENMGVVTTHKHSLTPGRVVAAYAVATHPSWAHPVGVFMTLSDLQRFERDSDFWRNHKLAMYRKTVIRALFNKGLVPSNDVGLREALTANDTLPASAHNSGPRLFAGPKRMELTADPAPETQTETPADTTPDTSYEVI